jgi:5'-nucleotidase
MEGGDRTRADAPRPPPASLPASGGAGPGTRAGLVVAVSSRSLFDLDAEHAVYEQDGAAAYARLQAGLEDEGLRPGPAFGLVDALSRINAASEDPAWPLVDIVVVTRNDPATGLRVLNAAAAHGLGASRAVMTGGRDAAPALAALGVDLFLTRSAADAASASAAGVPSAVLAAGSPPVPVVDELRLALDGDGVLFDDASERAFAEGGYPGWHAHERDNAGSDLGPGPLDAFARKLCALRTRAEAAGIALRIALVTARDGPARRRPVVSLRNRGIDLDEGFFLGGMCKGRAMAGFRPHLFLDDKAGNVAAVAPFSPSALVPPLRQPAANPQEPWPP